MKKTTISTQGLPLIILMQLEELTGKVDMVIEILKRIEVRLIRMEPKQEEVEQRLIK